MNKNFWIAGFLLILAAHLVSIIAQHELTEYITKPMLVAYLLVFFLQHANSLDRGLKIPFILALLLSWAGDVLLMFQSKDANFFMAGLGAFLLAHIGYIVFLHKLRVRESIRSNAWFLLIIVVYYASLLSFLSPYLGDMKMPVRVYGLVISFMLLLAFHMAYHSNRVAGRYLVIGACLFVISDSILAINKFYQPFAGAGLLIMASYAFAQLCLVMGAIRLSK